MAEDSQPRRSRRFSFTSRRPQSVVVTEELKSQPPVTTIGFPIDALPYPEAQQERPTSSWRNAFRRSQSVDRNNSRAPSSDRRSSRRLVKKQPGNVSSVPSQTPTLPNVPLPSNMTTARIQSRRASVSNNARDEDAGLPYTHQPSTPAQQYGYDRIRSNTTMNAQREQQKNGNAFMKDLPPAPATPTLRRVSSPFYHTAADKSAMSFNPPATTLTTNVEQRPGSLDSTQDDAMIPASLRVGRARMEESGGQSRDRATSPMQENPSYHSLPKYSPSDVQAQQANYDSITSLIEAVDFPQISTSPEQTPSQPTDAVESVNKRDERIKNLRPLKTMSPRPHHAKTPSSSSSSSYGSSTFSALGKPATPVSSNASTTNFEITSISTKSNTSKKEIPRNTMSPKHDKYLAKIFVVCCHCNYWHDVPSGMYAQMVIPECLLFSGLPEPSSSRSSRSSSQARSARSLGSKPQSIFSETSSSSGPSSSPKATVRCSWCKHEMAKSCCASWTTMVHLIEKHH
ncbi:hypothetical protein EYB25_008924 [Talaromyces marneffei]|nr:hypothetical protein EYB25_008924 [Talaromyces marneffei]